MDCQPARTHLEKKIRQSDASAKKLYIYGAEQLPRDRTVLIFIDMILGYYNNCVS